MDKIPIYALETFFYREVISMNFEAKFAIFFVTKTVQASQDEAKASKEVIGVLRKQVQTLQREKETLSAMKPELSEGQLLEILR